MEFPGYGLSPKRSQIQRVEATETGADGGGSPGRGRGGPGGESTSGAQSAGGSKGPFSKFFTQLKNLIAEATNIEPSSDVAPGVDHCCKTRRCHYGLPIHRLDFDGGNSPTGSSPSSKRPPRVTSRLIVYRDCDRRGRKILFDSDHVNSEYVYLKPTDPKLLKNLGEYVFGCVPLASSSSSRTMDLPPNCGHKRFCKWKLEGPDTPNKTMYIWSKIFELGSHNRNNSTNPQSATTVDYSSSSSEHSSSGYESGGGGAGKTFSLPLFNPRPSSRGGGCSSFPQTRSLPGRMESYKTNLAIVWLLSEDCSEESKTGACSMLKIPFPYLSPLVEKLMLNPLSNIAQSFYNNSSNFVTGLKNVSSSLNSHLTDFLTNPHAVNLSMVKPPLPDMVNVRLVCKFLELVLTNPDSSIVLNLKKWTEVKAVLYFLKMYLKSYVCKCNLLDSRRESLVETGTDVMSMTSSANELDGVDSGIELEGSSTRLQAVSSSSMYQSGRKWSIVSEEGSDIGGEESSQDEADCGRVSFHLGDVDVDQSEANLSLGEVDLSRLKSSERRPSIESTVSEPQPEITPSPSHRPPLQIKLNLSDSKLKDSYPVKFTPCFHCNGTYVTEHNQFNPFYFCQVLANPGNVAYEMEYVSFMKIIELHGSGQTRSFNLPEEASSGGSTSSSTLNLSFDDTDNELLKRIKEFVEGYVQLAKVTNDSTKLNNFVAFQLEEIDDFIP